MSVSVRCQRLPRIAQTRDKVAEDWEILFLMDQIYSLDQYIRKTCLGISPVPEVSTDSTDERQGSIGQGDPVPKGPNRLLGAVQQEELSPYHPGARDFHGQHKVAEDRVKLFLKDQTDSSEQYIKRTRLGISQSEFRSCVRVEVAVLSCPS